MSTSRMGKTTSFHYVCKFDRSPPDIDLSYKITSLVTRFVCLAIPEGVCLLLSDYYAYLEYISQLTRPEYWRGWFTK